MQTRMARSAWRWATAWFAALHFAFPATAQEALPFPGRTAAVAIMPAMADAGSARVITVSGMWNNGCIPVGASSSIGFSAGETLYTVTLALPETLAPCTAAFAPYSQTVTLTPASRGRFRLLAKTSLGEYLAEAVIDVRAASDNRPRADITGVWYEPSTNGSGLTFVQSAQVADLVFGTWYVYSADGGSRWYTIQNTAWR
ncbi:MAG TPA: hypothetical protein VFV17_08705, partial [Usitatibacteraceae bacterium]|nr:hypothetical protein [Usitatibacteraceae bacterium]